MFTDHPQHQDHVFVHTYARLHMGFLDLNGSLERHFGSLGLGLDGPDTYIELANGANIFGQEPSYVKKFKELILVNSKVEQEVSIRVHREIPRHFGLGSGTQMALAIGAGLNQLLGLEMSLSEIAAVTGRGKRSGIGIGTFAQGGIVLDGGRGEHTNVPPIMMQAHFPEDWRILLVFDHDHIGVHGEEEVKAFATLKDASLSATQGVNHQVLMQGLPALFECDLAKFSTAVSALQAYTGDYFAPAQGGRYASARVAEVLTFLMREGINGVGQSSWGPTGFAIVESEAVAQQYLTKLKMMFKNTSLGWQICAARNSGALVNIGNNAVISA